MVELANLVEKVRSKNAGPFWLTIDIFCGNKRAFDSVTQKLSTQQVATSLGAEVICVNRFEIAPLNVVKFSLPRPTVQGSIYDRDMHGASWAALIAELDV